MAKIEWCELSEKSKAALMNSGYLTVFEGAVRSGKTVTSNIAWLKYIINSPENRFLMSGNTIASLYTNVIDGDFGLLNIADGLATYKTDKDGNRVLEVISPFYEEPKVCYCVGGHDESSFKKIRGRTIAGWYADEINLNPKSFIEEALRRSFVSKDRKNFWTLNPDNPNHWIYKEYIDRYLEEGVEGYNYYHFTMDDNNAISEERKNEFKRQYKGAFYDRYVLGLRIIPEGLVYQFDKTKHTCSDKECREMIEQNKFDDFFFAVDWGWNHPLSCGFYGVTPFGKYYKIDELFGQQKDYSDVLRFIDATQKKYGRYGRFINADNEDPNQCDKLRIGYAPAKNGLPELRIGINVHQEKPSSVKDSVAVLRSIINFDRVIINRDNCPETIKGFETYRYPTQDELLKGKLDADKPLKENDDAADETRYGILFYETRYGSRFAKSF